MPAKETNDHVCISEFEVIEEIVEVWKATLEEDEEGADSFRQQVEDYYGNLWDDLHDSAGDHDYQIGVIERIQACQHMFAALLNSGTAKRIKDNPAPLTPRFTQDDEFPDLFANENCPVAGCGICRRYSR